MALSHALGLAQAFFQFTSDNAVMMREGKRLSTLVERSSSHYLVVLYLVAIFTPMEFSIGSLAMTPLRLVLIIATPPIFFNLVCGKYGRLTGIDISLMLYMVWSTISLAINNPSLVVQNAGSTALEFLGGYLVARACIRDRASFSRFCNLLGLIVAASLGPAVIELFSGRAILMEIVDTIPGVRSVGDHLSTRLGLERVQVAFPHPILYGVMCSTAISFTFIALHGETSHWKRMLLTFFVCAATFFSLSAGALFAMLIHLFLITWARLFRSLHWRWTLLLFCGIILYFIVDILSNRTPLRVFLSYATFSSQTGFMRLLIFNWGMTNVLENPIFGIGLNDWVRAEWMASNSVDNFWLLTTMRYGIPAFLFLAGAVISLLTCVGLRDFESDEQLFRYRRAWCFTMGGLCFSLTTVHVWVGPYSFLAFLLGAGVWFLNIKPFRDSVDTTSAGSQESVVNEPKKVKYSRFR